MILVKRIKDCSCAVDTGWLAGYHDWMDWWCLASTNLISAKLMLTATATKDLRDG